MKKVDFVGEIAILNREVRVGLNEKEFIKSCKKDNAASMWKNILSTESK